MKAAIFKGTGKIELEERPRPAVKEATDAVVRVVRACVCGSDLWYYRGLTERDSGTPIGHEFIGIVEETGSEVKDIKKGDFVIAPFEYSDGTCPHCQNGVTGSCLHGGFFADEHTNGGQGEFVRVPLADGTLVKVEGNDFSDETLASLLTLSDVMATGYHAAVSAGVKAGDTVAVVGDGAVGLCAVIAAKMLGASRIIMLSRHPARQALAKEFGATDIVEERGEAATETILKMTDGIGVDASLECVGSDEATQTAFAIARPGSVVGRVGVPHEVTIPAGDSFFGNIGMRGGPAPVRIYLPMLLREVLTGNINPGRVFDFTTDLNGIKEAYAAMDERRAIKSMLQVSNI